MRGFLNAAHRYSGHHDGDAASGLHDADHARNDGGNYCAYNLDVGAAGAKTVGWTPSYTGGIYLVHAVALNPAPSAPANNTWVKFNSSGTLTLTDRTLLDNLTSYWEMNEASGDAIDAHSSNQLTDNNTVGAADGGRDFESGNLEYFSHASNGDLQTGNIDFTLQAWVKLESTGNQVVIAKSTSLNVHEYILSYLSTGGFTFEVEGGQSAVNTFFTATAGVWYCIHAWQDVVNDVVGISINAGTPTTNALTVTPTVASGTFYLGRVLPRHCCLFRRGYAEGWTLEEPGTVSG